MAASRSRMIWTRKHKKSSNRPASKHENLCLTVTVMMTGRRMLRNKKLSKKSPQASRLCISKYRHSERGNLFFIIFLAVALFGALMFTFSRGARQGGDDLSDRQLSLAAADILSFSQQVERGMNRIYRRGFSENELSFRNSFVSAGYANANCTSGDRCRVFETQGGAVTYKRPSPDWSNSAQDWLFSGSNQVIGIGQDCTEARCVELTMMLTDIPLSLCQALNAKLLGTADDFAPLTDTNIDTATLFTGTFDYDGTNDIGDETAALAGNDTACFQETSSGQYHFYNVLLAR